MHGLTKLPKRKKYRELEMLYLEQCIDCKSNENALLKRIMMGSKEVEEVMGT